MSKSRASRDIYSLTVVGTGFQASRLRGSELGARVTNGPALHTYLFIYIVNIRQRDHMVDTEYPVSVI